MLPLPSISFRFSVRERYPRRTRTPAARRPALLESRRGAHLRSRCRTSPTIPRSRRRSSSSGSASEPSSSCASRTPTGRSGVLRRAGYREQDARRPHGVGADAEGRLPALQGAARLPPALPERLRLPGPLDRGRRRARSSASTRSARSRSTGSRSSPRSCREVVVWSADELTRGSIRLGQWMDWGNDYFTFSDTNIEYVWRLLKRCTSAAGCTSATARPSGARAAARRSRRTSSPAATSTAPTRRSTCACRSSTGRASRWSSGRRRRGRCPRTSRRPSSRTPTTAAALNGEWVAAPRYPDEQFDEIAQGLGAGRLALRGPVRRAAAGRGGRPPRDPVGRGHDRRGHRHRPHRARRRRRGLRALARQRPAGAHARRRVGPLLRRLRLAPRPLHERGRRADHRQPRGEGQARRGGPVRAPLPRVLALPHAADLPHRGRLVHLGATTCASRCATRTRRSSGCPSTWASAWTTGSQHGRLEHLPAPLLRAAAALLPVRVRASERHRLEAGARGARGRRARPARGAPSPWIDRVPIRCEQCGERGRADPRGRRRLARRRHRPVLDARLAERRRGSRAATAPARPAGSRRADLPDHAYWEKWFPADWVTEMREQIRLWFYSQLFMSVVLSGRRRSSACSATRRCWTRTGREMHGSWGNMIDADDAFARMGADVMRWQYCAQPPNQNLLVRLRAGAGDQAQAADALELGQVPRRLRERRGLGAASRGSRAAAPTGSSPRLIAGWSSGRTRSSREATEAYEDTLTVNVIRAFEAFVDDLSNWYIRRSRRRFWDGDEAALRTLWFALASRLPRHRRRSCRSSPRSCGSASCGSPAPPTSVFLAGWPELGEPDQALLDEIAAVRRVVELGRQARSSVRPEAAPAAPPARRRRGRRCRRTRRSCATSCASSRSSSGRSRRLS